MDILGKNNLRLAFTALKAQYCRFPILDSALFNGRTVFKLHFHTGIKTSKNTA
jgi:hypothetical protein